MHKNILDPNCDIFLFDLRNSFDECELQNLCKVYNKRWPVSNDYRCCWLNWKWIFSVCLFIYRSFVWNILFNYTGYRFVMILNICIQITVFSVIRFSIENHGFYLVMILFNNISFGGCLVMTPTFCQIVFGPMIGSKVYGIYTQILAISNLVQFAYVVGLVHYISFNGIIYICLGKSVVALILVIFSNF